MIVILTRVSEKKKEEEEKSGWERYLSPNKLCWELEMEGTVPLASLVRQEKNRKGLQGTVQLPFIWQQAHATISAICASRKGSPDNG